MHLILLPIVVVFVDGFPLCSGYCASVVSSVGGVNPQILYSDENGHRWIEVKVSVECGRIYSCEDRLMSMSL